MYFLLDLENVSGAAEEWLSHSAFDWGAQGMSEVLSFHQEEGEEAVETLASDSHHLHIYFEKCPDPRFLQDLKFRFPEIQSKLLEESDRDWLAEWKKGFHAFELVDGIYVVPSWLSAPADAKQVIWMEPGMAFGTGTHETTQLVASAYFRLARKNRNPVLDVGTGTGILAILAKQLGAKEVVAIDTDPEALRVAAENAARNEVTLHISPAGIENLDGTFDVVLANIIDGILSRIRDDLFAHVKRPGLLILSGILVEREDHFLDNFPLPEGASWGERTVKGDWVCRVVQIGD